MSGHSKWHSIKHKKGLLDARRGRLYTRLIREIQVAAKLGGPSPDANPRLRTAIQAARDISMPSKNIENAIAKGSGTGPDGALEELVYEGYGPGGVAFIVECSSDNRVRTGADIRHLFSKYGGNMGATGSVSFMFDVKGEIAVEAAADKEDELMMAALDAGANDVKAVEGGFYVYTEPRPDLVNTVREAIEKAGFTVSEAKVTRIPGNTTKLEGSAAEAATKLYDMLENFDDTQNVYTNMETD